MTRLHGHRIALTVAVSLAALALPGRVVAQTTSTSTSTSSTTSSTSTSTTSTSTTSTSTTSTSTTSTTVPCPPERCAAEPPTAVLAGARGEVTGEQGSSCWAAGPGRPALCRDSFFLDPSATLTVSRGELLSLRFATSETPRELVMYRHDRRDGMTQPLFAGEQSALPATNPSQIRADFPEGTSWLVVASKWSQGSAVTLFKVTVKATATKQPVLLALTG